MDTLYNIIYNHKLTMLINQLTRKSIINSQHVAIVSVVLPVSTKQCAVCTRLRPGVKSAWGKLFAC